MKRYWLKFVIYIAIEWGKGPTCVTAPSGILVLVLLHCNDILTPLTDRLPKGTLLSRSHRQSI